MQPKGVFMTFGVFAAVALVGFVLSFGVRGRSLEADWGDDGYKSDDEDGDDGEEA